MAFSSTFRLESRYSAWKDQCTVLMQTYNFQSILHDDAKTWVDAGPFKVKYPVNAENFKRILKIPILKARAFN